MSTMRRDKLLRLAKAGRLVSQEIYHFDDMHGSSRERVELPVRFSAGYGDWKDGYCNVREHDFKSTVGHAWTDGDSRVTLYIHSNSNIQFRILADGEQPPAPVSQDHISRRGY